MRARCSGRERGRDCFAIAGSYVLRLMFPSPVGGHPHGFQSSITRSGLSGVRRVRRRQPVDHRFVHLHLPESGADGGAVRTRDRGLLPLLTPFQPDQQVSGQRAGADGRRRVSAGHGVRDGRDQHHADDAVRRRRRDRLRSQHLRRHLCLAQESAAALRREHPLRGRVRPRCRARGDDPANARRVL